MIIVYFRYVNNRKLKLNLEDEKMKYNKEMTLGEILRGNEKAAKVLMGLGMHCLGCPSAQMETIEDAATVHGLNVNDILSKLEEEA